MNIQIKYAAGTNPEKSERERKNARRSRKIAAQGMVLLENDGTLPLRETGKKLALFGNGARHTIKGGTGSGDVNVREQVSIEQGLLNAGFVITTGEWLERYDREIEKAQEAYRRPVLDKIENGDAMAVMELFTNPYKDPMVIPVTEEDIVSSDTDTAVYVISRNSGEGKDRTPEEGDYLPFAEDKRILEKLTGHFKKVIVILNVGGVMDVSFLKGLSGISAILLMSQAGAEGGNALADILTGKMTPSGHLAATWAARYEDYPSAETFSFLNGNVDDEYYTEGIYAGYRYFDSFGITPVYPFGYGLSYTDFGTGCLEISAQKDRITLKAEVKNTGKEFCGKEVVQVYLSAPDGKLKKPFQELCAFGKTKVLLPGESEEMELSFALSDFASYDAERACYILEPGEYLTRLGNSSRNSHIVGAAVLSEEVIVKKLKNCLVPDVEIKEIEPKEKAVLFPDEEKEKEQAVRLVISADEIPVETVSYSSGAVSGQNEVEGAGEPLQKKEDKKLVTAQDVLSGRASLEEMVMELTVEEMAEMCVGTMRMAPDGTSFIGQSSTACPGAAGDTSSILFKSRGVKNLAMADGPAGLRINRFFAVDQDGELVQGVGDSPFPGMDILYGEAKMEALEGAELHYQFTTAIPIGTLLAQTWDEALIEEAGDLVGEEMEEFAISLWLAPGMNIQRNPLCGRNFEYYSEDPFLSGKCAAADTRGVQKHSGTGTTIKHFALNNQEDNRMHVCGHVSERAVREIYLKGFEIAVKESQPMAVMTSYNLLNGVHTANSHDLVTDILRDEWGFQGIVMTDWGTTGGIEMNPDMKFKYGTSSAAGCICAGNDLIMPGSTEDVENIIKAVNDGELPLECLRGCVTRLLRTILYRA